MAAAFSIARDTRERVKNVKPIMPLLFRLRDQKSLFPHILFTTQVSCIPTRG